MDFKKIEELFDIEGNLNGFSEIEISTTEKRLGIKFPKILRDYYQKLGKHKKLNHSQNNLKSLDKLKIDDFGILEFYVENQYVVTWGINVKKSNNDNPKVFMKYDTDWELAANNLKSFLHSMAYFQAIFASDFHANCSMISKEIIVKVKENFKRIDSEIAFWNGEFYQNKSTELVAVFDFDNQIDLYITAKNEKDFELAINKININWDYNSQTDE